MLRGSRLAMVAAGAALWLSGCNAGDAPSQATSAGEPAPSPAAAASPLVYAEATLGCRFTLPDMGLRAVTDHFDPATPPYKMKHSIAVTSPVGPVLRVDVWDDTEHLGLKAWFEKYLSFTVTPDAAVESRLLGKGGVPGIVVDQKRSPQSQAKRIAVFAQADRVFRVTCFDSEDAAALEAFQTVLGSFEPEARP